MEHCVPKDKCADNGGFTHLPGPSVDVEPVFEETPNCLVLERVRLHQLGALVLCVDVDVVADEVNRVLGAALDFLQLPHFELHRLACRP